MSETEDYIEAVVTTLVRDEGTILVFRGIVQSEDEDEDGRYITFGVDHRPAEAILEALADHDSEGADYPTVYLNSWQVL